MLLIFSLLIITVLLGNSAGWPNIVCAPLLKILASIQALMVPSVHATPSVATLVSNENAKCTETDKLRMTG